MSTPNNEAPATNADSVVKQARKTSPAKKRVTASSTRKDTTKKASAKTASASADVAAKPKTRSNKVKRAAAPAAETAPKTQSAVKGATSKTKRAKKDKVVRDSFTMPGADYAKLASLKQKCLDNGLRVKKSELLRAALAMLDAAPEKRIVAAVKALEAVKTGRPASA